MKKSTESPTPEAEPEKKNRKKEIIIGAVVLALAAAAVTAIVYFVSNSGVKIVYQPTKACDLLTLSEVKELIGDKAINSGMTEPVLATNTATSKCGYTDGNPDTTSLIVAAILVRSGINDKGVEQNKTEFVSGRPKENVQVVENVGEQAYFNEARGQLNILDGRNWIVVSYGPGTAQNANTLEDALKLAEKLV